MNLIETAFSQLSIFFWTSLALAFNDWIFKKRMENMFNRLEKKIKHRLNGGRKS